MFGSDTDLNRVGLLDQYRRWPAYNSRGMVSCMDKGTYANGLDTDWMGDALMVEHLAWLTALGPSRCIIYKSIYDRFNNASSNTIDRGFYGNIFRLKGAQEEIDNAIYVDSSRAMSEMFISSYFSLFRLMYDYDPSGTYIGNYNYGIGSWSDTNAKASVDQYYWGYRNRVPSNQRRYGWHLSVAWSDDLGKEYFAWSAHQPGQPESRPLMPMGGITFRLKNPNLTVDSKYGLGWGFLPLGLHEEAVSLNYSDGVPTFWSSADGSPRPGYENTEHWDRYQDFAYQPYYEHKFEKARNLMLPDHVNQFTSLRTGVSGNNLAGTTSLGSLYHDAPPTRLYRNAPVNLYLNEVAGYTNDNMVLLPKNQNRAGSPYYGQNTVKIGTDDYFRFGGTLLKIS